MDYNYKLHGVNAYQYSNVTPIGAVVDQGNIFGIDPNGKRINPQYTNLKTQENRQFQYTQDPVFIIRYNY